MKQKKRECIIYLFKEPVEYGYILDIQRDIVSKKISGSLKEDVLLILEHKPVFTIGKNGNRENLLVHDKFLQDQNIGLYHIERGGDITYHGPGQLIVYPIFNLKSPRIAVKEFVYLLEYIMIQTANYFNISLTRNEKNRGVWYNNRKVGSIGIAIKKGITFHGIALNILLDLTPFSWINPCGLKDIEVTSISNIAGIKIKMDRAKDIIMERFIEVFNLKCVLIKYLKNQDIDYEFFSKLSEETRVA